MKRYAIAVLLFVAYGCATTAPTTTLPQTISNEPLHGVASWYGEEFAGRTTANGEIFDPMLLTAAHRTLPFGTVVDVKNPKTGQTVRVRINDRGPFVGNRMIDLSFAAAQQIGLVEPGSGEVDVAIVQVGRGDREPPAPYSITLNDQQPAQKEKVKISPEEPPKVDFPLPTQTARVAVPAPAPVTAAPAPAPSPAISAATGEADFNVQVVEEHHGVETRRQVGPDGKTIQEVAVGTAAAGTPPKAAPAPANNDAPQRAASSSSSRKSAGDTPALHPFYVQAGAFGVEANAKALQEKLAQLGQTAHIDRDQLYRVRIGPFATREEAIRARTALEAKGMSAIVIGE
jgi:rare lipoprotein A